jgi:predicted nuclease of predicted toxin-antitoxin system
VKRLLFDQNLSPQLCRRLADLFPEALHVSAIGLDTASDQTVWEYARQHDYIIVTKDADFGELSLLRGFPPRVVWIRRGNCSTRDIEYLLRVNRDGIASLSENPLTGVLTLF